jgi:chaperonin GroES
LTIEPLFDRVLVQRDKAKEETETGIFIVKEAQEKPLTGTILAVGGSVEALKATDRVMFGVYAGVSLPADFGEDLLLMRADEVMARVA